ncbi:conserved hypothetical plastid protein (plastid) [Chondrus crispus]|uniref:Conserved hypothetical plastid protein n=1 Tax=Chondrus crispus TaxID=2769 RepID=M5DDB5_CHOCR|nr:conserved hypothetical plastid protein [Chondrus crispus]CCP38039.1 conserved hypothetical plastid protein [Chondrus crispus]|eukprot:YP_007627292.1 conserved hypothetical plastid protein (plastid) [Chondrus crispus]
MLTIYLICLITFLLPICLLITSAIYKLYKQLYISITILNKDSNNQINPYNTLILSQIYIKQHQWISSILILESGINQENTRIEQLYNNIGFCYTQIKAYNLSKYYYKKAIQQEPKDKSALYNLGQIYQILNDYKNADEIYKEIMQLEKNRTNQKISKYSKE